MLTKIAAPIESASSYVLALILALQWNIDGAFGISIFRCIASAKAARCTELVIVMIRIKIGGSDTRSFWCDRPLICCGLNK